MDITLYSATWCAPCKKVKTFLKENSICFNNVDMDTEEGQKKAQELKLRTIPFAIIDGEAFPTSDQIINKVKESL